VILRTALPHCYALLQLPESGSKITPSCKLDSVAGAARFPDHLGRASLHPLWAGRGPPFLVHNGLVQNLPDQTTKPMRNRPDRLAMVETRNQPREIAKRGFASTVLMGSIPGEEEELAAVVKSLNGKCIGYAMVDPTKPDAPRLIRQMKQNRLRGAAFFPAMHNCGRRLPGLRGRLQSWQGCRRGARRQELRRRGSRPTRSASCA
jgi:hypothetical protein